MELCHGCSRSFNLRGYGQHVRRTTNVACRSAHREREIAAELGVNFNYCGVNYENNLPQPPGDRDLNQSALGDGAMYEEPANDDDGAAHRNNSEDHEEPTDEGQENDEDEEPLHG